MRRSPVRRAPRPPLTRTRLYRLLVPVALAVVAMGTITILVLAAAVLFGIISYPGR